MYEETGALTEIWLRAKCPEKIYQTEFNLLTWPGTRAAVVVLWKDGENYPIILRTQTECWLSLQAVFVPNKFVYRQVISGNLIQNNVCKPNFKSSNGSSFWILSINYSLFINLMNDLQYKSINDPFAQLKDRDILFLYILMSPLTTADRDKYHSIRVLIVASKTSFPRQEEKFNQFEI